MLLWKKKEDNIQNELDDLKSKLGNKLKRVQKNFLGSLFIGISRSSKKSKEIKDLEIRMARLRVQAFDKNQQITALTTQRDNLQTQVNNLNRTIINQDQTIGNLRGEVNNWKNNYDNSQRELSDTKRNYGSAQSNYNYYYEQYRSKDREVDNLRSQLSSEEDSNKSLLRRINTFQSEINSLQWYKTQWDSLPPEREFAYIQEFKIEKDTCDVYRTVKNTTHIYSDEFGNGEIMKNSSGYLRNRISFRWFKVRGRVEKISSIFDDDTRY